MLDLLTMLVCIVIISLLSKVGLRRVCKVIRQLTKSLTVSLDGIYRIEKRSKLLCQHLIKNPFCQKKTEPILPHFAQFSHGLLRILKLFRKLHVTTNYKMEKCKSTSFFGHVQ